MGLAEWRKKEEGMRRVGMRIVLCRFLRMGPWRRGDVDVEKVKAMENEGKGEGVVGVIFVPLRSDGYGNDILGLLLLKTPKVSLLDCNAMEIRQSCC